jgi:hypothetical protein
MGTFLLSRPRAARSQGSLRGLRWPAPCAHGPDDPQWWGLVRTSLSVAMVARRGARRGVRAQCSIRGLGTCEPPGPRPGKGRTLGGAKHHTQWHTAAAERVPTFPLAVGMRLRIFGSGPVPLMESNFEFELPYRSPESAAPAGHSHLRRLRLYRSNPGHQPPSLTECLQPRTWKGASAGGESPRPISMLPRDLMIIARPSSTASGSISRATGTVTFSLPVGSSVRH